LFSTGNKELDGLIGPLQPRSMLLVVGHPGAGKTTLASNICLENALKGYKCLYISFYEDKEKLYGNMARLGIDLAGAESRGLLTHVKLPVTKPQEVLEIISDLVAKDSYRVVVLDSINPVIELYRRKEQRAVLLNFFYNLVSVINGLLVAIAEIPLGKETLNLGSIEFVADAIVYLKHRVSHGLLTRVLELRKARSAHLSVVEVPFDIVEKRGLVVYAPRRSERPMITITTKLKMHKVIEEISGPIYRGDVVVVSYPPGARTPLVLLPLIGAMLENDLKALVVSYKYSEAEVKDIVKSALMKYLDLGPEEAEYVVEKHIRTEPINPAAISTPQIYNLEIRIVEEMRPDIVVYHACEVPWRLVRNTDEDGYWSTLVNELTWLKNQGVLTARLFSRVDPHFVKMNESLADLSIRAYYRAVDKKTSQVWRVWRRGEEPRTVDFADSELQGKLREYSNYIRGVVLRS